MSIIKFSNMNILFEINRLNGYVFIYIIVCIFNFEMKVFQ